MDLAEFVVDFAAAMRAADHQRPVATSPRSGRTYLPGIGPHPEDQAVDLTLVQLGLLVGRKYEPVHVRVPYPGSRQKCDLVVGRDPSWAIEIKMARPNGDNGKPDDTATKDILSPYDVDHSALSDCTKLASTALAPRQAILVYGFEDERRPLEGIIAAFETLAGSRVRLGPRLSSSLGTLVHPVHRSGQVFAWEVAGLAS